MQKRSSLSFILPVLFLSTLSLADDHSKIHQPKLTPQNSETHTSTILF